MRERERGACRKCFSVVCTVSTIPVLDSVATGIIMLVYFQTFHCIVNLCTVIDCRYFSAARGVRLLHYYHRRDERGRTCGRGLAFHLQTRQAATSLEIHLLRLSSCGVRITTDTSYLAAYVYVIYIPCSPELTNSVRRKCCDSLSSWKPCLLFMFCFQMGSLGL